MPRPSKGIMPGADPIEDEDPIDPLDIELDPSVDDDDDDTPTPAPGGEEPAPGGEEESVEEEPAPGEEEPAPGEEEPEPLVPLSRLNKEIARRKSIEERLLAAPPPKAPATPAVDNLEVDIALAEEQVTEMMNMMLDNRVGDAAKLFIQAQRNAATQAARVAVARATEGLDERILETSNQSHSRRTVASVIQELEETYSVFDRESDERDEDLIGLTLMKQEAYISQGYTPDRALRIAADEALSRLHPHLVPGYRPPAEAPAPVTPAPTPTPAPVTPPKPTEAQVQKKLAQAQQQPPRSQTPRAAPPTQPKVNVFDMTDEEFDALTERELQQMRGDFFTG